MKKKKFIILGAIVLVIGVILGFVIKYNMEYMSKEQMINLLSKPNWDNYKMTINSDDDFGNQVIYKKDNITKIIFTKDSRYAWMNSDTSEVYLVRDGQVVGTQDFAETGAYKNVNEDFINDILQNGDVEYKYEKREKVNGVEYIVFKTNNTHNGTSLITWVNAENGLVKRYEMYDNNKYTLYAEFHVESGVVQDADIAKPNV